MQDWLIDSFGMSDGAALGVVFVVSLIIIFALFALVMWGLRRLGSTRFGAPGRTRQPRIAVMDHAHIDNRRRLLLIRRDNVEHLVLVGGPSDVVVEQNIIRGQSTSQAARMPYPQAVQPGMQPAPVAAQAQPPAAQVPQPPKAPPPAQPAQPVPAAAPAAPAPQKESLAARTVGSVAAAAAGAVAGAAIAGSGKRDEAAAKSDATSRHDDAEDKEKAARALKKQRRQQRKLAKMEAEKAKDAESMEPEAPPAAVADAVSKPRPIEVETPPVKPAPAPTASKLEQPARTNGNGSTRVEPAVLSSERPEPVATPPGRPSRGPASRLSETLFSRNKDAKPSRAGGLSASIAAAAGLRARKSEAETPAQPESKSESEPTHAPEKVEPAVDAVTPVADAPAAEEARTPAAPTADAAETAGAEIEPPAAAEAEPPAVSVEPSDAGADAEPEIDAQSVVDPAPAADEPETDVEAAAPEVAVSEETTPATPEPVAEPVVSAPVVPSVEEPRVEVTAEAPETNARADEIELDLGDLTLDPEPASEDSSAPSVEIASDERAAADGKNAEPADSIEAEMAKLLSELSGKPGS